MGTYNTTNAQLCCPRCDVESVTTVDLYLGETGHMSFVALGEPYPFRPASAPQNGGPTELGQGYAECPACGLDYFCQVHIRDGRLFEVTVDREHLPYAPTRESDGHTCPACKAPTVTRQEFRGYDLLRLICQACDWREEAARP